MGEYIDKPRIINPNFAMNFFGKEKDKARDSFSQFCKVTNSDQCLEMEAKKQVNDQEARSLIIKVCQIQHAFCRQFESRIRKAGFG